MTKIFLEHPLPTYMVNDFNRFFFQMTFSTETEVEIMLFSKLCRVATCNARDQERYYIYRDIYTEIYILRYHTWRIEKQGKSNNHESGDDR